jgi:hypothetical protein
MTDENMPPQQEKKDTKNANYLASLSAYQKPE